MNRTNELDFMDYRVISILEVMVNTCEILCPYDVMKLIEENYDLDIREDLVALIMNQLATWGYLFRYSPIGIPTPLEGIYYLGPKIADSRE